VAAGIVQAVRNQSLHAERAHVAEFIERLFWWDSGDAAIFLGAPERGADEGIAEEAV
jgi:hypothetical protein